VTFVALAPVFRVTMEALVPMTAAVPAIFPPLVPLIPFLPRALVQARTARGILPQARSLSGPASERRRRDQQTEHQHHRLHGVPWDEGTAPSSTGQRAIRSCPPCAFAQAEHSTGAPVEGGRA